MSSTTSGLSVQSAKTRVKHATTRGVYVATVVLAAVAIGCAEADAGRSTCSGQQTAPCMCANGMPGQRSCQGITFGDCICAPAPPMGTAGTSDFGNSDAMVTQTPDAMVIDKPDGQVEVDTTCGEQESQAVIDEERPVDVIFIIDNSGSMGEEIEAVERNINQNFAQIIEASGADFRVIMLTDHGSDSLSVCVDRPLAAEGCSVSTVPTGVTMGAPANNERFFQLDINVQSTDSVCLMIAHYAIDETAGPFPQTGREASPTGWHEWLREDALKVFVEITDDRLSCSVTTANGTYDLSSFSDGLSDATRLARDVYRAIQELSQEQFGTPQEPKFIWHSIVGIGDNDPVDLPYTHFDPPRLEPQTQCGSAVNVGSAYQMLSISTAGLRYPVCAADAGHGYDSVFRAIAHEVVRGSRVDCAFNIPTPPPGKFVDYDSVKVEYTPGDGSAVQTFSRVASAACDDRSFYYGDREIKLCDSACERVRADETAKINVVFGCGPEKILEPDVPE